MILWGERSIRSVANLTRRDGAGVPGAGAAGAGAHRGGAVRAGAGQRGARTSAERPHTGGRRPYLDRPRVEGGKRVPVRPLVSYSIERLEVLPGRRQRRRSADARRFPPTTIKRLYAHMVLTRQFDERMFKLQRQGRLGTFARVAGQEGAHVGRSLRAAPRRLAGAGLPGDRGAAPARHHHGPASAVLGRRRAGSSLPSRPAGRCPSPSRWARTCCTRSASAGR